MKKRSKEEIKRILWGRGELKWKLHAGQRVIDEKYSKTTGKLFVADCARQFGKSTWGVDKIVERAIRYPGTQHKYGTAFLTDLEKFIMPTFDYILADCPRKYRPVYKTKGSHYVTPYGSSIDLVGLDRKPNGMRGSKVYTHVLDEAGYISRLKYLYQSVIVPTTTHVPEARIIIFSTQPESPDHDFVEFCDMAELDEAYVKLDIYQNPLLTLEKIDEIALEYAPKDPKLSREERIALGKASTAFRREYLCERIVEENRAIVPEFNEKRHVRPRLEQDPFRKFYFRVESLDTAGSGAHNTGGLFGYYDFLRAKAVVEGEFEIKGSATTTRKINDLVRTKESELGGYENALRWADNNNLILISDLGSEFGLWFNPTTKDELHAMVNKVRLWFQSDRIEIDPNCTRLIRQCKAGIWDSRRLKFSESNIHGHYDLLAALVYFVRNIPESTNPIPTGFGIDFSNQILPNQKRPLSEAAVTLSRVFGSTNG
jgi:hypothetical protein